METQSAVFEMQHDNLFMDNVEDDYEIENSEKIENENNSLSFIENFDSPPIGAERQQVPYKTMLEDLDSTRNHANLLKSIPVHVNVGTSPMSSNVSQQGLSSKEKKIKKSKLVDSCPDTIKHELSASLQTTKECSVSEEKNSQRENDNDNVVADDKEAFLLNSLTQTPCSKRDPSPNVTMHTKGALESVSNMFSAVEESVLDETNTIFEKQFEKSSSKGKIIFYHFANFHILKLIFFWSKSKFMMF